ncbi:mycofactocin biosynthesis peptidyl-dipeptidase MftE [Microbacterium karelineae]|uniref:mycofactocin biosynthesis peptidyl-dipeptidase MftE n=1 Tax=Microbacterium karelineae TaxID=2654283 RepID=UPI0012EA6E3D|nr:mycofactocin biosynthesis peptidyl-dipeptidase MftE [Microbacterium karelineae]
MTDLGRRAWPDVDCAVVLLPVGSLEQHGPHLPLDTDTRIAVAVADGVAAAVGDAVVAPPLAYGSSGEHEGFPGTVSIGREALAAVLVEAGRSASSWARRLVFVNGHGGNVDVVRDAVRLLADEGRDASWIPCAPGAGWEIDAHAGRAETSLLLHLAPETVRLDRAEPGETAPIGEILPRLVAGGVRAVSANGVLGDPSGATAEEGGRLLAAMVGAGLARLDAGIRP